MDGTKKKVTMADIAERLGISKNSVSLALRGLRGVGDDLRRRISETAAEMGYGGAARPDALRDACLAVVIPAYLQDDIFFYSEVLWAIDGEAKAHGASAVHIGVTAEMEANCELPAMPRGLRVIGILIVGVFSGKYVERLKEAGPPLLSVDIMYVGLPYVGSSNLMGGATAARRLIGLGHREIGFIGPIYSAVSVYERWCGFGLAMREAGLDPGNGYNILGGQTFKLFDSEEVLEPYVRKIGKFPTAWFCAGDRIAIAMIHLLSRLGLRVPDDVSVMGFDDILAAQMVLPRLTTIRTDRKLMGRLSADYFFREENGGDAGTPLGRIVPFELVERESVKRLC
ncbi:MAG: LacI family DNA-binding transcriptional regulator [Firmicutes bacterium]|nr:LacI family DNA-binding transcriptional regulator [Bacillota bacterium]